MSGRVEPRARTTNTVELSESRGNERTSDTWTNEQSSDTWTNERSSDTWTNEQSSDTWTNEGSSDTRMERPRPTPPQPRRFFLSPVPAWWKIRFCAAPSAAASSPSPGLPPDEGSVINSFTRVLVRAYFTHFRRLKSPTTVNSTLKCVDEGSIWDTSN